MHQYIADSFICAFNRQSFRRRPHNFTDGFFLAIIIRLNGNHLPDRQSLIFNRISWWRVIGRRITRNGQRIGGLHIAALSLPHVENALKPFGNRRVFVHLSRQ